MKSGFLASLSTLVGVQPIPSSTIPVGLAFGSGARALEGLRYCAVSDVELRSRARNDQKLTAHHFVAEAGEREARVNFSEGGWLSLSWTNGGSGTVPLFGWDGAYCGERPMTFRTAASAKLHGIYGLQALGSPEASFLVRALKSRLLELEITQRKLFADRLEHPELLLTAESTIRPLCDFERGYDSQCSGFRVVGGKLERNFSYDLIRRMGMKLPAPGDVRTATYSLTMVHRYGPRRLGALGVPPILHQENTVVGRHLAPLFEKVSALYSTIEGQPLRAVNE